jgi:hypothetical protein
MSAESELKLTDIIFPLLVNVLRLPSWVPGTPTVLSAVLSAGNTHHQSLFEERSLKEIIISKNAHVRALRPDFLRLSQSSKTI